MPIVALLKSDGTLIEYQGIKPSGSQDLDATRFNVVTQNAINAGYKENEIDVKGVTDEEWATIQAAIPQPDPPPDILSDIASWVATQVDPPQSVVDHVSKMTAMKAVKG